MTDIIALDGKDIYSSTADYYSGNFEVDSLSSNAGKVISVSLKNIRHPQYP